MDLDSVKQVDLATLLFLFSPTSLVPIQESVIFFSLRLSNERTWIETRLKNYALNSKKKKQWDQRKDIRGFYWASPST
jgi:hypothetical protein